MIFQHLEAVGRAVGSRLAARGQTGPAGIDALVYRDSNGEFRLKPIVEVNPRYTMGHIALKLSRRLRRSDVAIFAMVFRSAAKRAGFESLSDLAKALTAPLPHGAVCLNAPDTASPALAIVAAGANLDDAIGHLPEGLQAHFEDHVQRSSRRPSA